MKVVFFVSSGDDDLNATAVNLRRAGKRVKHDHQVHEHAATALKPGKRSVVVAHGIESGDTVFFHRSSWEEAKKWIWVGMPAPPKATRIHLYSCYAALGLPAFLEDCEVVAHHSVVPFPVDEDKDTVLWFLHLVEKLLEADTFDAKTASASLLRELDRRLAHEADIGGESAQRSVPALDLLRKSLRRPPDPPPELRKEPRRRKGKRKKPSAA